MIDYAAAGLEQTDCVEFLVDALNSNLVRNGNQRDSLMVTISVEGRAETKFIRTDITPKGGELRLGSPQNEFLSISANDAPVASLNCNVLIQGRACKSLDLLPENSIQTVVTSPPYWSLRDYDVDQQCGCDETLSDYIADIVRTFEKIKRVLNEDGTIWLNVGDAYTSGNRRYRAPDKKNRARAMSMRPATPEGLKPKDLIGLPWRLAFALQDAGWWLRSEIIWNKPNAHPESVRDRPTKAHESLFLLSKSQDYYYDIDAVRGPNGRRLRTTWDIPTEPRKPDYGASKGHPAVMPATLAERCVSITSKTGDAVLDPYAGSGTTLIAAQRLERKWVGIELKSAFVKLMERRLENW